MSALPMVLMTDEEVAGFARGERSGFGALRTAHGLLPLVALEVDARVTGVIAAVEVVQRFVNHTATPIEATYIFPLPDRAAVHRFQFEVAGRVVDGVVEERGEARAQYDEAIARGHRAAISEEERAGVFTLRVGNLPPGEAATVRLSLVGPLPVDDGEAVFQFPLVVAPRYIPGAAIGGDPAGTGIAVDTHLVPDASRISPPVMLPGFRNPVRLAIRVALADHEIHDVASSLHAVTTTNRDAKVIELVPGERLDRDFILRWRVAASELRSSLACIDDRDGNGGTFAVTLAPPSARSLAAKPRDVVFVIDRSGSMEGWKMVAARRAVARMIDTLSSRDRFCAIAFDDSIESLPEARLVRATDQMRFRAVEALARVDSRGGTELAAPLLEAASMLAGGTDERSRVIVLVTDGQVGNEDHILRSLAPQLRNVRMFTLGIDQAVNAAFLRRLAAAGAGLCELVESEDRLDAVMAKVHRRIGTPIAVELALASSSLAIDRASIAPHRLPDVYAGAPVTILGRYRGRAASNATVELTGTTVGQPLSTTIARSDGGWTNDALAASWARAAIRDREDRYAINANDELEREIIAISKRHRVLSRFTAFLAVDRAATIARPHDLRRIVQPVDQPAGWGDLGRGGGFAMPAEADDYSVDECATSPTDGGSARSFALAEPEAAKRIEAFAKAPPPQGAMMGPPPAAPKLSAPTPAPARQSRSMLGGMFKAITRKEEAVSDRDVGSDAPIAYLTTLGDLARDLEVAANDNDHRKLHAIYQRLVEWVEDVRSVGHTQLAHTVALIAERLHQALAGNRHTLALAIVSELRTLAGGAPPANPPPARRAFWK